MIIPHDQLSPEALQGLLEEYAGREGTDYGDYDYSLEQKVEQLRAQLEKGRVVICYDSYLQSCTLMTHYDYQKLQHND